MDIEKYAERTAIASDYSYHCDVYEKPERRATFVRFWIRIDGLCYGRVTPIWVRDSPTRIKEEIDSMAESLDEDIPAGTAEVVPENTEFPLADSGMRDRF